MTQLDPWLDHRASSTAQEAQLLRLGYRLWWAADGSVSLTHPDQTVTTHYGKTRAQTLRDAYESAREHAAARHWSL